MILRNFLNSAFISFWCFIGILILFVSACAGMKEKKLAKALVHRQQDTMQHAYWKTMMQDTLSSYIATISAFELYWKNKERPIRDEDNEGENIFEKDKKAENTGNLNEVYDYKRFLNWKQKNQYRVKANGKVMTEYDILQQWKREHSDSTSR